MTRAARKTTVWLLAWLVAFGPAWADASREDGESCEELFRRAMEEEIDRGDYIRAVYADGMVVEGRFRGFSKDGRRFLLSRSRDRSGTQSERAFPGIAELRYRDLTGGHLRSAFSGLLAGLIVGMVVGGVIEVISDQEDDSYNDTFTLPDLSPFFIGALGATLGFGTGLLVPGLFAGEETIRCPADGVTGGKEEIMQPLFD